jgi:hypothetical protein
MFPLENDQQVQFVPSLPALDHSAAASTSSSNRFPLLGWLRWRQGGVRIRSISGVFNKSSVFYGKGVLAHRIRCIYYGKSILNPF